MQPPEGVSGHHKCAACGSTQPAFVHLLPYRGHHSHLCTSCVLGSHPGSFCPICFDVFLNNPPPPSVRALCFKCPSISHTSCIPNSGSSNYLCPKCSNPNFKFFDVNYNNDAVKFNAHLAKQLVAASSIAFEAMNNAAVMARINAEIRVKEALLAKEETGQVLERLRDLLDTEDHQFGSKFLPKLDNGTGETRFLEAKGCSSQSSYSDD